MIVNISDGVRKKYVDDQKAVVDTALNGKAPTSHSSTATTYGASSATTYGHAMASSTVPKANGTASAGSETAKFARGDHVHPLQTTVSGNAGTATKLQTARTVTVEGESTGVSFDGTKSITVPLARTSDVTADSTALITSGGVAKAIAQVKTTDANVTQTEVTSWTEATVPLLLKGSGDSGTAQGARYTPHVYYRPSGNSGGALVANAFVGNFNGTLVGNASTATTAVKASQDGNGNNIVSTYATKTVATTTAKGLMSSSDKAKLDGIQISPTLVNSGDIASANSTQKANMTSIGDIRIAWCSARIYVNSTSYSGTVIEFPTPFTNMGYSVSVTLDDQYQHDLWSYQGRAQKISESQCRVYIDKGDGGEITQDCNVSVIAIGV